MSSLTYITGPVRSGKSRRAVALAQTWGPHTVFLATYRVDPTDTEMVERVRRHQAERPGWRTLEAPRDPAAALAALTPAPDGVLMDCLTQWASDRFDDSDVAILAEWDRQLAAFKAAPFPVVIIGDEIGWSLVPADPAMRRFRDLVGWLGQRTAAAADVALLMVAGLPITLK